MKRNLLKLSLLLLVCVFLQHASMVAFAQAKNRRNFSWTFDQKNDPILQVRNQSVDSVTVEVRLLFDEDSYRYPEDLVIPSGESRFLRIREALERLARRYADLARMSSGIVQIQFMGDNEQIESTIVNLNPKMGVTSDKSSGQNAPVIRSVDPQTGSPSGGTVVTIAGENFTEATTVKFGGIPAMRNLQSSEILIAISPPHSTGSVDVEVNNGRTRAGLRRAFTYTSESPVILRLDPDSGSPDGGDRISIRGQNFQPGSKIFWDRRPLASQFVNPDEISVTAPAGPRGLISVDVLNPDGSRFTLENAFRYAGGPVVIAAQPGMGSPAGGYRITVTGDHFDPGCSVLFNGNYGETTFINPRTLSATVPPGQSGPVDVTVSTEEGETHTLQNAFVYNAEPVIYAVAAYPNPIVRNTTTTITVEADDPEAGPIDYEYRVARGLGNVTGQGRSAIYNSPNVTETAVIQVTVYDQYGAKAQQNLEIQVE